MLSRTVAELHEVRSGVRLSKDNPVPSLQWRETATEIEQNTDSNLAAIGSYDSVTPLELTYDSNDSESPPRCYANFDPGSDY